MTNTSRISISFLLLLSVGGCVTLPTGPSVMVLPGSGKSFEQFQTDDLVCRNWAGQQVGMSSQEIANRNTATGAVAGTLLGAGLGAAIGLATGSPGTGAAIGAGSGLLFGTTSGSATGQSYGYEVQNRYDIAYQQCMYSKGNQIPGVATRSYGTRSAPPVPPPPGP
jgi:outer membrane lipoprotein SlyB